MKLTIEVFTKWDDRIKLKGVSYDDIQKVIKCFVDQKKLTDFGLIINMSDVNYITYEEEKT